MLDLPTAAKARRRIATQPLPGHCHETPRQAKRQVELTSVSHKQQLEEMVVLVTVTWNTRHNGTESVQAGVKLEEQQKQLRQCEG